MINKKEIRAKAHHSIMLILGARKLDVCPECGSEEWHIESAYTKVYKEFSDGHIVEVDFSPDNFAVRRCYDCHHEKD